MHTQQGEQFEPVDKPVRPYETVLFAVAMLLVMAAQSTLYQAVELAAAVAVALLMLALPLWQLFVPPRFSSTRGAFVLMGVISLWLLWRTAGLPIP